MVGVIVVVRGFQPGGDPALGVATGVLVAISYIAPAADRAWRRSVERDADRIVVHAGLAGSLVHYAQWQLGPASVERVESIAAAAEQRKQARAQAEVTAPPRQTGGLVLTHPTAHR